MKVYLIGAGPGDPRLLTLKAADIIKQCDVVVYDDLVSPEILGLAGDEVQKIYVGKRAGRDYMKQPRINTLVMDLAQKGQVVARLKGGDPCVFGRGGEEAMFLKECGIPFEIVPGVTSAIAGPVYAGIPLTYRGYSSSLRIITAHEDPYKADGFLDWSLMAKDSGTLVILMGASRIASIASRLIGEGMDPLIPCALVQEATTPVQRYCITTLQDAGKDAERAKIASPCIIVIGRVVELSRTLYTKERLPLSGKTVLVTRPLHLSSNMARLLTSMGACPVVYPLIELRELGFDLVDPAVYDVFIFTSQNAVDMYFARMYSEGLDARAFKGVKIICIGPKTRQALKRYGIMADFMAEDYRAEGVMAIPYMRKLKGKRVCLPRARGARPWLKEALEDKGNLVDEIFVYETIIPHDADKAGFERALDQVDIVIFTSPSGARNAAKLLDGDISRLKDRSLAAIGPVTQHAMEALGMHPEWVAAQYTDEGIMAILKEAP